MLISLCSASGAPGVTCTALGLALSWPRPTILVEADPSGGSSILGGYLRASQVPSFRLVDAALSHRQGRLREDVLAGVMPLPQSQVMLLAGVHTHEQVGVLAEVWLPLTQLFLALDSEGIDVIVDAGRLGMQGSPVQLMEHADQALLVTGSSLPELTVAMPWAKTLAQRVGHHWGLAVVGENRPYSAEEIRDSLGIPLLGSLSWQPQAAQVLTQGTHYRKNFAKSSLMKNAALLGESIRSVVTHQRDSLVSGAPELTGMVRHG